VRPMKLALVSETSYVNEIDGALARRLAIELANRKHNVSVVCAAEGGAWGDKVRVVAKGSRAPRFAFEVLAFDRWKNQQLARLSPDHVISLTTLARGDVVLPMQGTIAGQARSLCRVNAPLPVRVRSSIQSAAPSILCRRWLEKRAVNASRRLLTLTDTLRAELGRIVPERRERIQAVLHLETLEQASDSMRQSLRASLARALNIGPNTQWLVYPFRSAWVDGFEPMMLAFKALIDRGSDAVLLLAGECKYTYMAWVAHLGLRERVRFVGVPDHLEQLAAVADVFVLPTDYDPLGWRVLTALECGKRVITTTACGLAERVRQQGGAVLDSPADPNALLAALERLIAGPEPEIKAHVHLQTPSGRLADAVEAALNRPADP